MLDDKKKRQKKKKKKEKPKCIVCGNPFPTIGPIFWDKGC